MDIRFIEQTISSNNQKFETDCVKQINQIILDRANQELDIREFSILITENNIKNTYINLIVYSNNFKEKIFSYFRSEGWIIDTEIYYTVHDDERIGLRISHPSYVEKHKKQINKSFFAKIIKFFKGK